MRRREGERDTAKNCPNVGMYVGVLLVLIIASMERRAT